MSDALRMAKQVWRGVPYMRKELERRFSMQTGIPMAKPQSYYVIFSGKCNFTCSFCTIYHDNEVLLSEEVMLRIVRESKELSGSGFNISVSGGEPLIYKAIYPALELAHQLGVNLGITTNGYSLGKANVRRILASDPFNINVSIESVDPKINESLRFKKDATLRALEGIENVIEEKRRVGSRVSLVVKPTIMEQNYQSLPDLVRYFHKYKEVQVNLQPYSGPLNAPFWVKDLDRLKAMVEELKELKRQGHAIIGDEATLDGFADYFARPPVSDHKRFIELNGQKRGCDIGFRTLFIYARGEVHFCDYLSKPVGNIYQNSLSEIYYSEMAKKLRRQIDYCNIDCQNTCKRPIPLATKVASWMKMG
jgi:MoaA/NifB/PqqE/SkfB family radical SAM enzyme